MEAIEGQPQFDEWAIVELFGHQKMAGHVTQAPIGDMLRIDVYDGEHSILYTRFVNPKAIYAINPTSKEVAIAVGEKFAQPPVSRWDAKKLLPSPEPEPPAAGPSVPDWTPYDDEEDEPYGYDVDEDELEDHDSEEEPFVLPDDMDPF